MAIEAWPPLRYDEWADTAQTLRLWTQVAGKVRMALTPPVNHCWNVTLYVTSRGLSTSPIPIASGAFEIELDFVDHCLRISRTDGARHQFALEPMTVAAFYERTMAALTSLDVAVTIHTTPSEIEDPIPFEKDTVHRSYDADAAARFWRVLVDTSRVFASFRCDFLGKVSPIHFFWGGMDLAVTRFSGREAPPHGPVPGLPLRVVRDAYSHEVSSAGFWPGGPGVDAVFYSYAYPTPAGYASASVQPSAAFFHADLGEFLLPYEAVRASADPDATLLEFLRSTYAAAADHGGWDRRRLERSPA
jgi:hypothetical protein